MRLDYDYVIVGGGMAADAAARGIREADPDGSIAILGQEADPPYARPPLTKDLWRSDAPPVESVFLDTAEATGAHVVTSCRVTQVRRAERTVVANDDDEYGYRALLLATGGSPRHLDADDSPEVITFRRLGDFERLRTAATAGSHVGVVGGGFVGLELACSVSASGARVTLVTPDDAPGSRAFPPGIVTRLADRMAAHDVAVLSGRRVTGIEHLAVPDAEGERLVRVTLEDGATVAGDVVVAGLGIAPDTALAHGAGLRLTDGGIDVDVFLRTSDPHVYAAGDVARIGDPILGARRVEHVDQAQTSGRAAGRNMAASLRGSPGEPFEHTPFFYSDLYDDGYEAVGTLDSRLTMVEDWRPGAEDACGVVCYVAPDGALRGVLLWNLWDRVDHARALLAELAAPGAVADPQHLRGRIPLTD